MTYNLKPGALSNEDKAFIEENSSTMSAEEIAQVLGRKITPIQKYIDKMHLATFNKQPDNNEREILRRKLEQKYWYPNVCRQLLNDDEKSIFKNKWIDFMLQFREDVLASEEEQIRELILLHITLERVRISEAENLLAMNTLQKKIEKEYNKDILNRHPDLPTWEIKYAMCITNTASNTKTIKDINHDLLNLNKDLKGTRDQRFKQIDSGDKTFIGLIRRLQDDEQRLRISREAELVKLATEKKRLQLMSNHPYADGEIDIPVLNVESVKLMKELQESGDDSEEQNS